MTILQTWCTTYLFLTGPLGFSGTLICLVLYRVVISTHPRPYGIGVLVLLFMWFALTTFTYSIFAPFPSMQMDGWASTAPVIALFTTGFFGVSGSRPAPPDAH